MEKFRRHHPPQNPQTAEERRQSIRPRASPEPSALHLTEWAESVPGVVLVGERHRADGLAHKVHREGKLEDRLHLTRLEVLILEANFSLLTFLPFDELEET